MVTKKNGKISFLDIEFQIMIDGILSICDKASQVEWLQEQMTGCIELCCDSRLGELDCE